jgi:CDGSH-type Zn-finger protein
VEDGKITMKITVSKNGPYIVSGSVPLIEEEVCNDDEGYCQTWRETKKYPVQERYALCRCGNSQNKPFCDGTHAKVGFHGT